MRQVQNFWENAETEFFDKFEKRLESFAPSQYPQLADFNEKHTLLWLKKTKQKISTNQENLSLCMNSIL